MARPARATGCPASHWCSLSTCSASAVAELDHLVWGVPDLLAGVRDFADRTGVEPVPGGRHVGRGTANYLVGLGVGAYLEIIGPDPDAVEPPVQLPFGVELITEPRLLTWAVGTSDVAAAVASARTRGYDPGDATAMSRETATGTRLQWQLTPDTVRSKGGLLPFLIDWGTTRHPSQTGLPHLARPQLFAASPEPEQVRAELAALDVDLVVSVGPAPRLLATLRTPAGTVTLTGGV